MLKTYVKTAWRNLVRTAGYSTLNILGLSIGMGVALLIGIWVYDQYSYEKFLPDHERVYRVMRNFNSNGDTLTFATTSLALSDALRNQIPDIEYVVESDWMEEHGLVVGDKKLYLSGGLVASDFEKMFRFPLVKGSMETVLRDPYSIVLTQSTARALFGDADPMGKTVRFDNMDELRVTGVLKDLPLNTSFDFHFLVPFRYLELTDYDARTGREGSFQQNGFQIFVKLKPNADKGLVAAKIRNIEHTEKGNVNAMNSYVILHPMDRWHLYGKFENGKDGPGFLVYVRLFAVIGVLVLLIACINFINLTTARSEKRAREVGVRKAIGSSRKDLIFQFLMESFLLTFIAFLVALMLVQLGRSPFNALTGESVTIPYSQPMFWVVMLAFVTITALIAGSRPAFYLSSFQPVKVLKGALQIGRARSLPRKLLVVLQFTCSIAFVISTIIIYRQIQYARDRPNGYDLNRVLNTHKTTDLEKNYPALKNELLEKGIVAGITTCTSPATAVWWHTDIEYWPGKHPGETVEMGTLYIDDDFLRTVGMSLKEGQNFTDRNDTTSVLFNETAIARLRIKDPLNRMILWQGKKYRIIGVVGDALQYSPFERAHPTMFFCKPNVQNYLIYRLAPTIKTQDALTQLAAVFSKYNPTVPYQYKFEDENYANKFRLEVLVGKLSGLFAGLAIFISCLGLLGLAAYVAERRTKEISIRKVLGASVSQLWILLSKDFLLLVLISCVVASPLTLYFLHNWLMKYEYRVSIGAGVFILAAVLAIALTIITISFQAMRAAMANPVEKLRSE
ncbi:MAG TPA: ABC transporter permease [Puia sp.]|nr:ABC transporter permease [Puia sp.]